MKMNFVEAYENSGGEEILCQNIDAYWKVMLEENKLALKIDKATRAYINGRFNMDKLAASVEEMKYSFQETGRKISELKKEIEIPIGILNSGLENMEIKIKHVREIHRRTMYEGKKFDPPPIVEEEIKEEERKELKTTQQDEKSDNEFTKSIKNVEETLSKIIRQGSIKII